MSNNGEITLTWTETVPAGGRKELVPLFEQWMLLYRRWEIKQSVKKILAPTYNEIYGCWTKYAIEGSDYVATYMERQGRYGVVVHKKHYQIPNHIKKDLENLFWWFEEQRKTKRIYTNYPKINPRNPESTWHVNPDAWCFEWLAAKAEAGEFKLDGIFDLKGKS